MTEGLVFYPGENFDPYDEDDREAVRLAMAQERYDRIRSRRRYEEEEQ